MPWGENRFLADLALRAIEKLTTGGFPILRRIARNATERKLDQRMVFGFTYQTVLDPFGYQIWFYQTVSEPKPPRGAKVV